jgi:hypothetical protein
MGRKRYSPEQIITMLLGNVLTAGVGKVLDIYRL